MKTPKVRAYLYEYPEYSRWSIEPATKETYDNLVNQIAHVIDPEAENMCAHFEKQEAMGSTEPWYDYRKEAKNKAVAVLRSLKITKRGRPA